MANYSLKKQIADLKGIAFPIEKSDELKEECARLEGSLYEFTKAAWHVIEGRKYIDNWHIGALAEHLMAASSGQIRRLLISMPPRISKSTLTSIMWPAWVWTREAYIKWFYSSYGEKVALEQSRVCKMLIRSAWYQTRWGDKFFLLKDQATKSHFVNSRHGFRMATSVSSATTAFGGDVLVSDDPNKVGESEVTRESTNDYMSRTWPSRANPEGLKVNVLLQQRSHDMDVSGLWLSRYGDNMVKLILPMEFELSRRAKTIILPSTNGKVWEDPRTEEGELLSPNYLTATDIAEKKIELGSYNYAGQYQQRPAPEGGGLIKETWFQIWKGDKPPKLEFIVQSWDTAFTEKKTGSYSACTTWGIFKTNKVRNLILLSAWRGRVAYPDLLKRAVRLYNNWTDIGEEAREIKSHIVPDTLIIEAKASGQSLAAEFIAKGIPAHRFVPDKYGDKLARVHKITSFIEAGLVWVARNNDRVTSTAPDPLRHDHQMLIENCALFPADESRDLVDSMTQALLFLTKEKGLLKHTLDLGFMEERFPEIYKPGFQDVRDKEAKGHLGG